VLFGKALASLYRPRGVAGADVKVLCGKIGAESTMLGIQAGDVIEAWESLILRR
jgi:hypothetical protein